MEHRTHHHRKTRKKRILWAGSALVVLLFVAIVVVGIIHEYIHPDSRALTDAERSMAESEVSSILSATGESISAYNFSADPRVRLLDWNGTRVEAMSVCLANGTVQRTFVLDAGTGDVLMQAMVLYSGKGRDLLASRGDGDRPVCVFPYWTR